MPVGPQWGRPTAGVGGGASQCPNSFCWGLFLIPGKGCVPRVIALRAKCGSFCSYHHLISLGGWNDVIHLSIYLSIQRGQTLGCLAGSLSLDFQASVCLQGTPRRVRFGLSLPPLGILALCSHSTRTDVKPIFLPPGGLQGVGYDYLYNPEVDLQGVL